MMMISNLLVSVTETSESLLASGVPHVELDGAQVGVEEERVHLHTQSSCQGVIGDSRMILNHLPEKI
jgi:hypothetical protein